MPSERGVGATCVAEVASGTQVPKSKCGSRENRPNSKPVNPQKKGFSPGVLAISTCPTKPLKSSTPDPTGSQQVATAVHSKHSSASFFGSPPPCFSFSSTSPASNFKSVICHFWQQTGKCAYGDSCHFAHGADEKRQWDRKLRRGASHGGYDVGEDAENDDVRQRRVQRTFRNDGQFSSQAFAKDKRDVRQGGRKLSNLASGKRLNWFNPRFSSKASRQLYPS